MDRPSYSNNYLGPMRNSYTNHRKERIQSQHPYSLSCRKTRPKKNSNWLINGVKKIFSGIGSLLGSSNTNINSNHLEEYTSFKDDGLEIRPPSINQRNLKSIMESSIKKSNRSHEDSPVYNSPQNKYTGYNPDRSKEEAKIIKKSSIQRISNSSKKSVANSVDQSLQTDLVPQIAPLVAPPFVEREKNANEVRNRSRREFPIQLKDNRFTHLGVKRRFEAQNEDTSMNEVNGKTVKRSKPNVQNYLGRLSNAEYMQKMLESQRLMDERHRSRMMRRKDPPLNKRTDPKIIKKSSNIQITQILPEPAISNVRKQKNEEEKNFRESPRPKDEAGVVIPKSTFKTEVLPSIDLRPITEEEKPQKNKIERKEIQKAEELFVQVLEPVNIPSIPKPVPLDMKEENKTPLVVASTKEKDEEKKQEKENKDLKKNFQNAAPVEINSNESKEKINLEEKEIQKSIFQLPEPKLSNEIKASQKKSHYADNDFLEDEGFYSSSHEQSSSAKHSSQSNFAIQTQSPKKIISKIEDKNEIDNKNISSIFHKNENKSSTVFANLEKPKNEFSFVSSKPTDNTSTEKKAENKNPFLNTNISKGGNQIVFGQRKSKENSDLMQNLLFNSATTSISSNTKSSPFHTFNSQVSNENKFLPTSNISAFSKVNEELEEDRMQDSSPAASPKNNFRDKPNNYSFSYDFGNLNSKPLQSTTSIFPSSTSSTSSIFQTSTANMLFPSNTLPNIYQTSKNSKEEEKTGNLFPLKTDDQRTNSTNYFSVPQGQKNDNNTNMFSSTSSVNYFQPTIGLTSNLNNFGNQSQQSIFPFSNSSNTMSTSPFMGNNQTSNSMISNNNFGNFGSSQFSNNFNQSQSQTASKWGEQNLFGEAAKKKEKNDDEESLFSMGTHNRKYFRGGSKNRKSHF